MSDAQLYLAIGLPTVTSLVGILVNVGCFIALNGRLRRIEGKMDAYLEKNR